MMPRWKVYEGFNTSKLLRLPMTISLTLLTLCRLPITIRFNTFNTS